MRCVFVAKGCYIVPAFFPLCFSQASLREESLPETFFEIFGFTFGQFFSVNRVTTVRAENHAPQNSCLEQVPIYSARPKLGFEQQRVIQV